MNRREGLKYISAGCAAAVLKPSLFGHAVPQKGITSSHLSLSVNYSPSIKPPKDEKIPFNLDYFLVGTDDKYTILKLNKSIPRKFTKVKFRLTTAVKINGKRLLEVSVPGAEIIAGIIDLRFAPALQVVELEIENSLLPTIKKNGIRLRLTGEEPVLFIEENNANAENFILLPHLFFETGKSSVLDQFFSRLYSLNSVQEFGWMEGCVLDGLWQIHEKKNGKAALETIKDHLSLFLETGNNKSRQYDIFSIESTLPLAIIAKLYPEHPIIKESEDFWKSRLKAHGGIVDYSITAEGSYTIAYPMAVLSKILRRPDLAEMALHQLRIRQKLVFEGNNYLRYYPDSDSRTYKNWARGIAWYMLGLIRSISILKDSEDIADLKEEFIRVSQFVLPYQKPDGLFNCYIDDPETLSETSGSAGIAAAIAAGIDEGLLSQGLRKNILRTWEGLIPFLTPDGLLSGVSQSNSGGEELQRSGYRVISQMGMGLMAQLYAYIH